MGRLRWRITNGGSGPELADHAETFDNLQNQATRTDGPCYTGKPIDVEARLLGGRPMPDKPLDRTAAEAQARGVDHKEAPVYSRFLTMSQVNIIFAEQIARAQGRALESAVPTGNWVPSDRTVWMISVHAPIVVNDTIIDGTASHFDVYTVVLDSQTHAGLVSCGGPECPILEKSS